MNPDRDPTAVAPQMPGMPESKPAKETTDAFFEAFKEMSAEQRDQYAARIQEYADKYMKLFAAAKENAAGNQERIQALDRAGVSVNEGSFKTEIANLTKFIREQAGLRTINEQVVFARVHGVPMLMEKLAQGTQKLEQLLARWDVNNALVQRDAEFAKEPHRDFAIAQQNRQLNREFGAGDVPFGTLSIDKKGATTQEPQMEQPKKPTMLYGGIKDIDAPAPEVQSVTPEAVKAPDVAGADKPVDIAPVSANISVTDQDVKPDAGASRPTDEQYRQVMASSQRLQSQIAPTDFGKSTPEKVVVAAGNIPAAETASDYSYKSLNYIQNSPTVAAMAMKSGDKSPESISSTLGDSADAKISVAPSDAGQSETPKAVPAEAVAPVPPEHPADEPEPAVSDAPTPETDIDLPIANPEVVAPSKKTIPEEPTAISAGDDHVSPIDPALGAIVPGDDLKNVPAAGFMPLDLNLTIGTHPETKGTMPNAAESQQVATPERKPYEGIRGRWEGARTTYENAEASYQDALRAYVAEQGNGWKRLPYTVKKLFGYGRELPPELQKAKNNATAAAMLYTDTSQAFAQRKLRNRREEIIKHTRTNVGAEIDIPLGSATDGEKTMPLPHEDQSQGDITIPLDKPYTTDIPVGEAMLSPSEAAEKIRRMERVEARYERMLAQKVLLGRIRSHQDILTNTPSILENEKVKKGLEIFRKTKWARAGALVGLAALGGATGGLGAMAVAGGIAGTRLALSMGAGAGASIGAKKLYDKYFTKASIDAYDSDVSYARANLRKDEYQMLLQKLEDGLADIARDKRISVAVAAGAGVAVGGLTGALTNYADVAADAIGDAAHKAADAAGVAAGKVVDAVMETPRAIADTFNAQGLQALQNTLTQPPTALHGIGVTEAPQVEAPRVYSYTDEPKVAEVAKAPVPETPKAPIPPLPAHVADSPHMLRTDAPAAATPVMSPLAEQPVISRKLDAVKLGWDTPPAPQQPAATPASSDMISTEDVPAHTPPPLSELRSALPPLPVHEVSTPPAAVPENVVLSGTGLPVQTGSGGYLVHGAESNGSVPATPPSSLGEPIRTWDGKLIAPEPAAPAAVEPIAPTQATPAPVDKWRSYQYPEPNPHGKTLSVNTPMIPGYQSSPGLISALPDSRLTNDLPYPQRLPEEVAKEAFSKVWIPGTGDTPGHLGTLEEAKALGMFEKPSTAEAVPSTGVEQTVESAQTYPIAPQSSIEEMQSAPSAPLPSPEDVVNDPFGPTIEKTVKEIETYDVPRKNFFGWTTNETVTTGGDLYAQHLKDMTLKQIADAYNSPQVLAQMFPNGVPTEALHNWVDYIEKSNSITPAYLNLTLAEFMHNVAERTAQA